jgi:hypothetical protein
MTTFPEYGATFCPIGNVVKVARRGCAARRTPDLR